MSAYISWIDKPFSFCFFKGSLHLPLKGYGNGFLFLWTREGDFFKTPPFYSDITKSKIKYMDKIESSLWVYLTCSHLKRTCFICLKMILNKLNFETLFLVHLLKKNGLSLSIIQYHCLKIIFAALLLCFKNKKQFKWLNWGQILYNTN